MSSSRSCLIIRRIVLKKHKRSLLFHYLDACRLYNIIYLPKQMFKVNFLTLFSIESTRWWRHRPTRSDVPFHGTKHKSTEGAGTFTGLLREVSAVEDPHTAEEHHNAWASAAEGIGSVPAVQWRLRLPWLVVLWIRRTKAAVPQAGWRTSAL